MQSYPRPEEFAWSFAGCPPPQPPSVRGAVPSLLPPGPLLQLVLENRVSLAATVGLLVL